MADAPAARLAAFLEQLEGARRARGVTLIVVTKRHPASLVRELAAVGQRDFGESRHPESRDKAAALADLDLTWHFVGQLQRNKARQVARYAHVLHSIDAPELVEALEGGEPGDERPVRDALVQVNLSDDPARGGVAPDGLDALAERVAASPALRLRGVMAVAPLGEEPAAAFERLARLAERVRAVDPAADWISAGMSGDWREALEHGATHLRIGTAITGNRPLGG
ncbi:YggS family pyridoxal phosphate-dependent enzyme [Agrococcus sp. SCSIO52902]|uniref:YggS family pyridoxal phosphate-dependent enzyme n=1 Tax=Agrococcus sp. SCSIO52902 TaxID=2933290 RepID=UPI001FF0F078|nr:YggS family pyridoxal phosphate-dependent enzyme [Agrococcus sp. SCSIO52902]UOW00222.1 YggS family pyridoxal phosphate-dependent enzyme [Agrococcus sp. SCSIO52902]